MSGKLHLPFVTANYPISVRACNVSPEVIVKHQTPSMRKLLILLTAWMLFAAACSKSGPADNGCISRTFIYRTDLILTPSQTQTADSLFTVNHIDHSSYRYYQLDHDTFYIRYPPSTLI